MESHGTWFEVAGESVRFSESACSPAPLALASFNLQVFGQTKADKPEVMSVLARILSQYDLFALQEIRDAEGTARTGRSVSRSWRRRWTGPDAVHRYPDPLQGPKPVWKEWSMSDRHEPELETTRLLLRPMQATDIDDLLCIFADRKVMAAFDSVPFDRPQMARWLERNLDHQAEYGYGLFSVILKTNGILIGDCGLGVMEVDGTQVAELGYDFRSDYWNQGFATEAAAAVRDYAFNILNLPRLISLIRIGNGASQRVAEKIGMGRIAEFTRYGNRYWKYGIERVGMRCE